MHWGSISKLCFGVYPLIFFSSLGLNGIMPKIIISITYQLVVIWPNLYHICRYDVVFCPLKWWIPSNSADIAPNIRNYMMFIFIFSFLFSGCCLCPSSCHWKNWSIYPHRTMEKQWETFSSSRTSIKGNGEDHWIWIRILRRSKGDDSRIQWIVLHQSALIWKMMLSI